MTLLEELPTAVAAIELLFMPMVLPVACPDIPMAMLALAVVALIGPLLTWLLVTTTDGEPLGRELRATWL